MPTRHDEEQCVRASTVDGIFYPQEPDRLREEVKRLLNGSSVPAGAAQSIVAPHAAFEYSGMVAASAFMASAGRKVELAVLLGPVHREPADAVLLPESGSYQTPLGEVPVDRELVRALAARGPGFRYDELPHLEEHCLEVLLPFLQELHPQARLAPVLLGRPSRRLVESLSDALEHLLRGRLASTLLVVSSNMSAFLPSEQSAAQSRAVLERIEARDWEALVELGGGKRPGACGAACVAAILLLHRRIGGRAAVLATDSSLAAGGDPKRVVQYAAVAFYGNEP